MELVKKMGEIVVSVVPVVFIVLILHFFIAPLPPALLVLFLLGALLVTLGLGLFNFGAEKSVVRMGEHMGEALTKSRSLWLITLFGFLMGFMVTLAEPDLQVLAQQVFQASDGLVAKQLLMIAVSVGVGIFVAVALLRIVFQVSIKKLLLGGYILVFLLAGAVSLFAPDFLSVAFDSGGVTTGPMTVPFILALGVGVSSVRGDERAGEDSFGLVALASIGPIITVLLLGLIYGRNVTVPAVAVTAEPQSGFWMSFISQLKHEAVNVAVALAPTTVGFLAMQVTLLKLPKKALLRIGIGLLYTYLGLVLFLTGVNVGFSAAADAIGAAIAATDIKWALIPIGVVLGFAVVFAEPAVYVLNKVVEEVSGGYVSRKLMLGALSISVATAVGLSMLRVLTGLSIWWFILPGYLSAALLMKWTPVLFTAIAFDSGGVASGPMTATFILSMAMGASRQLGGNILTEAFGVVALVAMMPVVVIQIMGIIYHIKTRRATERDKKEEAV